MRDGRLPYDLPFSTGELVKLEGPVFSEPLYGVWCGEELPDSQSRLGEISEEICQVREKEGKKAAVRRFWECFRK